MILMNRIRLLFVLPLLLTACAGNEDAASHVFRYNESNGVATLDPAFAKSQALMWPVHQLYSTLVETDDSLHLRPLLARHWQVSEDGLTYTFTLRQDVFFHDDAVFEGGKGRKLLAKDVAFSLGRLVDVQVASTGAWIFHDIVSDTAPFRAINDSVFLLKLKRPYGSILKVLTMPYCSVVAQEAVVAYGADFRRHPVGTGPFQLVAWAEGQSMVLKKNSHYFERDEEGRRLPYLDGIQISFAENKASEFLSFQQNKIDFINDIDPGLKDELLTKTGKLKKDWQKKARLQVTPFLNTEYLGILSDSSKLHYQHPLNNILVRRAIASAINKNKMLLYLRNSIGIPAWDGFVPPSLLDNRDPGYEQYDPKEARRLLAMAGYNTSNPVPEFSLVTAPAYTSLGSFIVNDLNQVGFRCKLEIIQKGLLLQKMSAGQVVFFRGSWIADFPDAINYMSVFYSKNPAPPNYTRFSDSVFDAAFEEYLLEKNEVKRRSFLQQMDSRIRDRVPIIPLWYDQVLHLSSPDLVGFHPNSFNMLELRRVKK